MAKLANYFISGVWKDSNDNITHVLLHMVNDDNSFQYGVKTTESVAINLIKQRNTIKTITWGYPNWQIGASVTYVNSNNREYLRTVANATQKDNLDNAINMSSIRRD
ncbi:DUF3892 domain-containing protein [Flagellimonas aequoris]|uniref:DUF3892 domain-containing protein n=1 Tax=Flagellimonas aequoris TaxID=2306997 RepID=A0A418N4J4_9FLAO|nr:DUF3892 domain-containing protein [Allomuricauda aequoris]RIV68703.1 DUF3892 domain-containing protein [Allomuricauda aequoris]TXK00402.1 DUF3892 domain-containing protein [Allomuricauda aequoris]